MTQEEFDALDDTVADAPAQPAATGGAMEKLKAQGPVRLAAVGMAVVAVGAFGGMTLFGGSSVQVTGVQDIPAQISSAALPSLPQAPDAVAALAPTPIREVQDLEQTQATAAPAATAPSTAAPIEVADACAVTTASMPLAGALIALEIKAPCDAGVRADIFQGDLQIAVALDAEGHAEISLPALTAAATVAVVVENRAPVSLLAQTSDIESYSRSVLYWQGDMGLELHAFETADADYGIDGHVAPDRPANIARALSGNGGYLTALGDPSLTPANVALVYTAPADKAVEISIEAPVTAANCTQEVFAGTIRVAPGTAPDGQELSLTLPACDAVGEYVMLTTMMAGPVRVDLASN